MQYWPSSHQQSGLFCTKGWGEGEVGCWVLRVVPGEWCGQLIKARAVIMIVTWEFPWRRAARESHSPTVSPMWPRTPHTPHPPNWYLSAEITASPATICQNDYLICQGALPGLSPPPPTTSSPSSPVFTSSSTTLLSWPSSGTFQHRTGFFSLESISLKLEHLSKRGSVFVFSFQTVILHFLSPSEARHASLASFTIYHQNTDLRDTSQGITEV